LSCSRHVPIIQILSTTQAIKCKEFTGVVVSDCRKSELRRENYFAWAEPASLPFDGSVIEQIKQLRDRIGDEEQGTGLIGSIREAAHEARESRPAIQEVATILRGIYWLAWGILIVAGLYVGTPYVKGLVELIGWLRGGAVE
jgi:hypothetical protein